MESIEYNSELKLSCVNFNFRKINNILYYNIVPLSSGINILLYDVVKNKINQYHYPTKGGNIIIKNINETYLLFNNNKLEYITKDFKDYKIPNIMISIDIYNKLFSINNNHFIIYRSLSDNDKFIIYKSNNLYDWVKCYNNIHYPQNVLNAFWNSDKQYNIIVKDDNYYLIFKNYIIVFNNKGDIIKDYVDVITTRLNDELYLIYNKDDNTFININVQQ